MSLAPIFKKQVEEKQLPDSPEGTFAKLLEEEEKQPTTVGVLLIRIKSARNLISNKLQPGVESMYCKVSLRNQTKRTNVVQLLLKSCDWNQTKHLPTTVVRARHHPFNLVRIQLFAFNSHSTQPHTVLGSVVFHLHDIIKVTKVSGTFDLSDGPVFVGELELDVAFCYGIFGYGYSAQLKEEPAIRSIESHLEYSLFPRINPPPDRVEPDRVTLIPKAVPHPPFLKLREVVQLSYAREVAPLLESIDDNPHEEFMQKYMQRYYELRAQLRGIKERHKRLQFLHHAILSSSRKQEAIKAQPMERKSFIRYLQPAPKDIRPQMATLRSPGLALAVPSPGIMMRSRATPLSPPSLDDTQQG